MRQSLRDLDHLLLAGRELGDRARGSMSTSRSARMRLVPSYIGARLMTPKALTG